MNEKEYRQHPGISRSELWMLRELRTPEKFLYALQNPEAPTPAMIFGQVLHKLLLEPFTFGDEFVIAPAVDRRTKEGKAVYAEFLEQKGDRIGIAKEDFDIATAMVQKALATPFVSRLLKGEREKPIFWTDEATGIECKARLDVLTEIGGEPVIVDYKTTSDASDEGFARSAVKYGYDLQDAFYSEGIKALTGKQPKFIFIAQEKIAPYALNIFEADPLMYRRGYDMFRELLGQYRECSDTQNWYGYLGPDNRINMLALPAWALKE